MNIARMAVVSATALALVAGSYGMAGANSKEEAAPEMPAVVITGGTITNTTDINIGANAGTGIADASGGSNNVGTAGGGGLSTTTASVGNGGSADAAANGGAVSMGDVSSGSNSGNAIIVGNTNSDGGKDGGDYGKDGGGDYGKDGGGDYGMEGGSSEGGSYEVVALPSTGVGGIDAGLISMIAAAGAAGAAGLGLRRR